MIHIIFDYDFTLFDTGYLISKMPRSPKKGEVFSVDIAKEFDWDQVDNSKLHYQDTDHTLEKLTKLGYQLYLFTEGDIAGQQYKIDITTVKNFIPNENIHIYEQDKIDSIHEVTDRIPDSDKIYYVEDKPSYLKDVKAKYPQIKTVQIKQGPWQDFPVENFAPDITINTLSEFLNHL